MPIYSKTPLFNPGLIYPKPKLFAASPLFEQGGAVNLGNLPQVGPFQTNAAVPISGLTNTTVNTQITFSHLQNRAAPLKYNTITFGNSGSLIPDYTTTAAIFVWANNIVMAGNFDTLAISTDGQSGTNGAQQCCGEGIGGNGSSGGGGGGTAVPFGCPQPIPGGNGGSGGNGDDGQTDTCGAFGAGGKGFGLADAAGYASYGNGGNGGVGGLSIDICCQQALGGNGGNGYSGAGGGGQAAGLQCIGCAPVIAAGGGAGGGLIVMICNSLSGSGVISSSGGYGGDTFNPGDVAGGGGGAGGVIWIAAKKYDGQLTAQINGGLGGNHDSCTGNGGDGDNGNVRIFQINHDGTLGTEMSLTDSWDNT